MAHMTVLGRIARLPLRLVPPATRVGILLGPLRGTRWIVGSSNHGCWLGSYEQDKLREFARWVTPGSVVYDIGAHVGYYTLLASRLVGPMGRVIAFEPVPRNLGFLREHLFMNEARNVEVVDAAVARQGGRGSMDPGDTSLQGRLSDRGALDVRTVGLDELVQGGLPEPGLIKIDVEGGELAALEGARGVLRRSQPAIFLATHGDAVHRACVALLEGVGYSVRPLGPPEELLAFTDRHRAR